MAVLRTHGCSNSNSTATSDSENFLLLSIDTSPDELLKVIVLVAALSMTFDWRLCLGDCLTIWSGQEHSPGLIEVPQSHITNVWHLIQLRRRMVRQMDRWKTRIKMGLLMVGHCNCNNIGYIIWLKSYWFGFLFDRVFGHEIKCYCLLSVKMFNEVNWGGISC